MYHSLSHSISTKLFRKSIDKFFITQPCFQSIYILLCFVFPCHTLRILSIIDSYENQVGPAPLLFIFFMLWLVQSSSLNSMVLSSCRMAKEPISLKSRRGAITFESRDLRLRLLGLDSTWHENDCSLRYTSRKRCTEN